MSKDKRSVTEMPYSRWNPAKSWNPAMINVQ